MLAAGHPVDGMYNILLYYKTLLQILNTSDITLLIKILISHFQTYTIEKTVILLMTLYIYDKLHYFNIIPA